ncbi:MAG: hypothetical protein M1522_07540 [Actinobacteria bacterium]|nr:hypothetical protein [Actinomycetota bacterium]
MSKPTEITIEIYTQELQDGRLAAVAAYTTDKFGYPEAVEELGYVDVDGDGIPDFDMATELAHAQNVLQSGGWAATAVGYCATAVRQLSEHAIVVAGIEEGTLVGDGTRVTAAGADALNRLILNACGQRWSADNFRVIPGGEANDEWNRLVGGWQWETEDSVGITGDMAKIREDVICGDWEPSWSRPVEAED